MNLCPEQDNDGTGHALPSTLFFNRQLRQLASMMSPSTQLPNYAELSASLQVTLDNWLARKASLQLTLKFVDCDCLRK